MSKLRVTYTVIVDEGDDWNVRARLVNRNGYTGNLITQKLRQVIEGNLWLPFRDDARQPKVVGRIEVRVENVL